MMQLPKNQAPTLVDCLICFFKERLKDLVPVSEEVRIIET